MPHRVTLWRRFLHCGKGVANCPDLPLNISREVLQENPLLEAIKKSVTRSVLEALEQMKADEYDKYVTFFGEFGSILKEGPRIDWSNRERIAELFLFESMKTPAEKFTTLAAYAEAMP